MTNSKRKPAATPAKVPAAKRASAQLPRRAAAAVASKTAVKPTAPPAPAVAAKTKTPPTLQNSEKRTRCSFTLAESQIALLGELKKRCLAFGVNVKKGELLAAGLQLLKNFPETALEAAVLPSMRSDRQLKIEKKRKK